jgi:hypothetical protein
MPPSSGDMFVPSAVECPLPDRCYMLAMDINSATMAMKYPFMLSTNGGNTWTTFADPFYNRPQKPTAFTSYGKDLAMFFGSDTIVLMTRNGGSNAKSWFVPKVGDIQFMKIVGGDILNDNTGYLFNGQLTEVTDQQTGKKSYTVEPVGALLKTNDLQMDDPRDMTWEALFTDQALYPLKLQFINENVGYMITQDGDAYNLRKTTDGGRNWTQIQFPQVDGLEAIKWVYDFAAFDENNLIVVTGIPNGDEDQFGVIYTISDGITPVAVTPDPTDHAQAMMAIRCIDRYLCYAAGEEATVLKFTDEPPVVVEEEDTGSTSEEADRDVLVSGDDGSGQIEDVTVSIDVNGPKPADSDSGCSAGASPASGPFGLLVLLLGCAVALGAGRFSVRRR